MNLLTFIALNAWPIFVVMGFEQFSRVTSSYYMWTNLFAIATLTHIPIFFAVVFHRMANGCRWPVILAFVAIQFAVVPMCLRTLASDSV